MLTGDPNKSNIWDMWMCSTEQILALRIKLLLVGWLEMVVVGSR